MKFLDTQHPDGEKSQILTLAPNLITTPAALTTPICLSLVLNVAGGIQQQSISEVNTLQLFYDLLTVLLEYTCISPFHIRYLVMHWCHHCSYIYIYKFTSISIEDTYLWMI